MKITLQGVKKQPEQPRHSHARCKPWRGTHIIQNLSDDEKTLSTQPYSRDMRLAFLLA